MLRLHTNTMELRGITTQTSKKGTTYYIVYCEDCESFEPYKFYCKDYETLPQGLKKGDKIHLTVDYNNFKELVLVAIQKVS